MKVKERKNLKQTVIEKIENEEKIKNSNKSNIKKLNSYQTAIEKSGLSSHYTNIGHNINFETYTIIDSNNSRKKLEIIETLHIKTTKNMNKMEDKSKIGPHFNGILKKIS